MGSESFSRYFIQILWLLYSIADNTQLLFPQSALVKIFTWNKILSISLHLEWLLETGRDTNFTEMDKQVLADTLKIFYPSARQQNSERYSKQALINLRSGLNWHLTLPPFNKPWNLMHNKEFHLANKVFSENLREQKAAGLDVTRHKPLLPKGDIELAFANYLEPHWDNDPKCPQLKIYFDLGYYMARWAKERLRELRKDHFKISTTAEGRKYVELLINEATKKSQGDDHNELYDNAIMVEQPDSPRCQVASFELYLSKLKELPDLFQQPNPCFKKPSDHWYKKALLVSIKLENSRLRSLSLLASANGIPTTVFGAPQ